MATDLYARILTALSDAAHASRFLSVLDLDGRLQDIAADCEVDVREIAKDEQLVASATSRRMLHKSEAEGREQDDSEPVTMCEAGCGPSYGFDPDGVPLCAKCIADGNADLLHEIGALVGWEEGTDIVAAVRAAVATAQGEA